MKEDEIKSAMKNMGQRNTLTELLRVFDYGDRIGPLWAGERDADAAFDKAREVVKVKSKEKSKREISA